MSELHRKIKMSHLPPAMPPPRCVVSQKWHHTVYLDVTLFSQPNWQSLRTAVLTLILT